MFVWRGGEPGNWSDVPHLAASLGVGCEMPEWMLAPGDGEKGGQPEILNREKRVPGIKLVVRQCMRNSSSGHSLVRDRLWGLEAEMLHPQGTQKSKKPSWRRTSSCFSTSKIADLFYIELGMRGHIPVLRSSQGALGGERTMVLP